MNLTQYQKFIEKYNLPNSPNSRKLFIKYFYITNKKERYNNKFGSDLSLRLSLAKIEKDIKFQKQLDDWEYSDFFEGKNYSTTYKNDNYIYSNIEIIYKMMEISKLKYIKIESPNFNNISTIYIKTLFYGDEEENNYWPTRYNEVNFKYRFNSEYKIEFRNNTLSLMYWDPNNSLKFLSCDFNRREWINDKFSGYYCKNIINNDKKYVDFEWKFLIKFYNKCTFTIWKNLINFLPENDDKIKYIVWQLELVKMKNLMFKVMFNLMNIYIKKIFNDNSIHLENTKGSFKDNRDYCTKKYDRCKKHKSKGCKCDYNDIEHRCEMCNEKCKRIIARNEIKIREYDLNLNDFIGPFEEEEKKRNQELLEDEMLEDLKIDGYTLDDFVLKYGVLYKGWLKTNFIKEFFMCKLMIS
ncbi:hypothetical protein C1645_837488 [Glomus cerebriforme]|uniref:CRESS-DNA virus Rep endonuclease domain-containing protein n=1 Tax=Glomus cerebriforme TaxID=658196 RepID=A0A397S545_9GLOM|nr:hypothetical protein C1645_837488 [Glomus cerebriforme]